MFGATLYQVYHVSVYYSTEYTMFMLRLHALSFIVLVVYYLFCENKQEDVRLNKRCDRVI